MDRNGECFGVVILRLENMGRVRKQTVALARTLHRRLRDTDEKGHLGIGRLGVMLPDTNSQGTEFVLNSLLELAASQGLAVAGEAFVYPDQDDKPPRPRTGQLSAAEFVSAAEQVSSDLAFHESSAELASQQPQPHQASTLQSLPLSLILGKYPAWKRCLDITGAAVGLCISAPLIGMFAGLIRLSGPGPIFFTQARTGYLGETFNIYKLRTMVEGAEQQQHELGERNERDGPAFKMRNDPRVTRLGRLLRATGLDELPQLYNVLRGDMSLVGPRPLPVSEAEQCLPWQRQRQLVKPGLTCYWQLIKSRQVSFAQWMRLDMQYVRRLSFGLDVRLIVRTFASVLLGRVGH